MDPNITSLFEAMHDNVKCAIVINGQSTAWFVQWGSRCKTGLFVITYPVQFVPGVRHNRPEEFMQGVQIRYQLKLCIGYANNTTIMSNVFEKLQILTDELQEACRK